MATFEDIQSSFVKDILTLCTSSDYYSPQKGFVKIPLSDEESKKKWSNIQERYSFLLEKENLNTRERWVKDCLQQNTNWLEIISNFSSHINDYQQKMMKSHNLSAQITGIRDLLEDLFGCLEGVCKT